MRRLLLFLTMTPLLMAQTGEFYLQGDQLLLSDPSIEDPIEYEDSVGAYSPGIWYQIDWYGYEAGIPYRYEWRAPDGEIFRTYENTRTQNSNGGSWARISSQNLWKGGLGQWNVEFFYQDISYAQASFDFVEDWEGEFLAYYPEDITSETPIFVAVHSSSYNPVEYFHFFLGMAMENQAVLIAPYFPQEEFRYQRLFLGGRSDHRLLEILENLWTLYPTLSQKVIFYGHSAGAQYVHRFTMYYPGLVERAVVSAPGFWTFPDESQSFPYGVAPHREAPPEMIFQAEEFLRVPILVLVGEEDTLRTDNVNQSESADLQGQNRLERAIHWNQSMEDLARSRSLPDQIQLMIVSDRGHTDIRSHTEEMVEGFLFP